MRSPTRTSRHASPSSEFSFAVPRRAVSLTQFLRELENGTVTIKKTRKRQWFDPGEAQAGPQTKFWSEVF